VASANARRSSAASLPTSVNLNSDGGCKNSNTRYNCSNLLWLFSGLVNCCYVVDYVWCFESLSIGFSHSARRNEVDTALHEARVALGARAPT